MMMNGVEWQRWWRDVVMWWGWVVVGLMLPLAQRWLLPLLLLVKNIDGVL
jgi:hypothetical protein